MKRRASPRDALIEAIEEARDKGAEYIRYGGYDTATDVKQFIEQIRSLPEELGAEHADLNRWFECDADGNRIIRSKEIYGFITNHETGVIVWNGSDEVFCGNWGAIRGLPRSFGPAEIPGESRSMTAVCIDRHALDDDTLELAFDAAMNKGDKTPTIHEVFRINNTATIITFDGWP